MSGHSKWSNIKHKKEAEDKKRAAAFAKIARELTIEARQGGGDPEKNQTLRKTIEKAKEANMPKDKIDQAIKRGTGETKAGEELEELLMEGYGPGGAALLIKVITDNRNRASAEIRHSLSEYGGKLAGEGSVKWLFEQYAVFKIPKSHVKNAEDFELSLIEAGAEDIEWPEKDGENIVVYSGREDAQNISEVFKNNEFYDIGFELEWVPKNKIEISEKDKEKLEKLFEALDEQDDVQEIYANVE